VNQNKKYNTFVRTPVKKITIATLIAFLLSTSLMVTASEQDTRDRILEAEAISVGFSAYIWGFVYVKSMLLRDEAVNPNYHTYTPINNITSQSSLAKPGFTDFTPNNDTLYGLGWLDLSQGPVLMTVPASDGRYWTMQGTDYALNSMEYVGSRVKSEPGVYAYVQKDWKGELPDKVTRIDSPSDTVFLQLRTYVSQDVDGDLEKVLEYNRSFKFESFNKDAKFPAVSKDVKIRDVKNTSPNMTSLKFFDLLNEAITRESPLPGEEAAYVQFSQFGIGPGLTFDPDSLTESQRIGLQKGIDAARGRIMLSAREGGIKLGGFNFRYGIGSYGNNFNLRTLVAFMGYGANTDVEALYNSSFTDEKNQPLNGGNLYRINFEKDNLPPVDAFWSFTIYQLPGNQLVENSINRYNINGSTKGLKYNADGSLTIYLQHEEPEADKASNWLPIPEAGFWIILRTYNPQSDLLEGKYIPPYVENLSAN
jgi:hypothetical protein